MYHYAAYRCTLKALNGRAALMASPNVPVHLDTLLALFIKPIKHSCRPAKSPGALRPAEATFVATHSLKLLEELQRPTATFIAGG